MVNAGNCFRPCGAGAVPVFFFFFLRKSCISNTYITSPIPPDPERRRLPTAEAEVSIAVNGSTTSPPHSHCPHTASTYSTSAPNPVQIKAQSPMMMGWEVQMQSRTDHSAPAHGRTQHLCSRGGEGMSRGVYGRYGECRLCSASLPDSIASLDRHKDCVSSGAQVVLQLCCTSSLAAPPDPLDSGGVKLE